MKRGKSSAYLKMLRRKYRLGEFKRKGKTSSVKPSKKKLSASAPSSGYYPWRVADKVINPYLLKALDYGELLSIDPYGKFKEDAEENAEAFGVPVPWKDGTTERERYFRDAYIYALDKARKRDSLQPLSSRRTTRKAGGSSPGESISKINLGVYTDITTRKGGADEFHIPRSTVFQQY